MTWSFVIEGEPVPWARVKRGQHGNAYVPERVVEAENRVGWAFKEKYPGFEPDREKRYHLRLTFRCKSKRRTDVSNLVKLVEDGLNEIGPWWDDWQIDSHDTERIWVDSDPCTEVVVTER